jgi:hypothetical protein
MNFEVILISYNMNKFATSGIFNLFLKKFTPILTLSFARCPGGVVRWIRNFEWSRSLLLSLFWLGRRR